MGLLMPELEEVKLNRILEEKIATMQRIIDEHQRYKLLYEQSQTLLKDKDKKIEQLNTEIGALKITKMEADKLIYDMRSDLKRMGEIENRDIGLWRTEIINTMKFLITLEQAKLIGGLALFANKVIQLRFDGNTGALVKAITDTDERYDVPPEHEQGVSD